MYRMTVGFVILLVLGACVRADSDSSVDTTSRIAGRPSSVGYNDTASIARRVDSIERIVKDHPDRMKLFASVAGREGLVPVPDTTSWPDEVEASYNIVFDVTGMPLLHRQMPSSESGDWFQAVTHYFAPDGRTILYDDEISGFNECTRILRERTRIFLSSESGQQIAFSRRFTDGDSKPLSDTSGCLIRGSGSPRPALKVTDLSLPRSP